MRLAISALGLAALAVGPSLAKAPARSVPDACLEYRHEIPNAGDAARLWNEAYGRGFAAIQRGDFNSAEAEMCRALVAARDFDPRDWRYAETLDELGLIAFELSDYELAESMQGAAIAEMLLAVGPRGEPLDESNTSEHSPVRSSCRSGVRVYITRLGWILERTRGRTTTDELRRAPWRVFAAGYLPLDARLAEGLDWLVSRYLLEENLAAAEALVALQREIVGEASRE